MKSIFLRTVDPLGIVMWCVYLAIFVSGGISGFLAAKAALEKELEDLERKINNG